MNINKQNKSGLPIISIDELSAVLHACHGIPTRLYWLDITRLENPNLFSVNVIQPELFASCDQLLQPEPVCIGEIHLHEKDGVRYTYGWAPGKSLEEFAKKCLAALRAPGEKPAPVKDAKEQGDDYVVTMPDRVYRSQKDKYRIEKNLTELRKLIKAGDKSLETMADELNIGVSTAKKYKKDLREMGEI